MKTVTKFNRLLVRSPAIISPHPERAKRPYSEWAFTQPEWQSQAGPVYRYAEICELLTWWTFGFPWFTILAQSNINFHKGRVMLGMFHNVYVMVLQCIALQSFQFTFWLLIVCFFCCSSINSSFVAIWILGCRWPRDTGPPSASGRPASGHPAINKSDCSSIFEDKIVQI